MVEIPGKVYTNIERMPSVATTVAKGQEWGTEMKQLLQTVSRRGSEEEM